MSKLKHKWTVQDLIKENRITEEEISSLAKWVKEEELAPLTHEQLACLHLSCDNNFVFTQKTIRQFLKTKKDAPKVFNDRRLDREEYIMQLNTLIYCIIPKRTEDGSVIMYHALQDFAYWKYNMEFAMAVFFMTIDRAIYEYPPESLTVIFDMKGVGLMHLTRARLSAIKAFFNYLQDGLPVKLKEIHVLNTVYFFDKCMSLIRPFMKKHIYDMLHLHSPSMKMSDFHTKYVPKSCLPNDLGGDLPSTLELHEENIEILHNMQEYFDDEEAIRQRL